MYNITIRMSEILDEVNKKEFVSPTKIGLNLGFNYNNASSNVCKTLKILKREGLVSRNKKGHYRITAKAKRNYYRSY